MTNLGRELASPTVQATPVSPVECSFLPAKQLGREKTLWGTDIPYAEMLMLEVLLQYIFFNDPLLVSEFKIRAFT